MKDCVFCKIESGEIPSERIYEDEDVFVINDLHPQAKIHYLMIPKKTFCYAFRNGFERYGIGRQGAQEDFANCPDHRARERLQNNNQSGRRWRTNDISSAYTHFRWREIACITEKFFVKIYISQKIV